MHIYLDSTLIQCQKSFHTKNLFIHTHKMLKLIEKDTFVLTADQRLIIDEMAKYFGTYRSIFDYDTL